MVRLADCNACQMGNHAGHERVVSYAGEGVMGGIACHCKGDCAERNKDWAEQLVRRTFGTNHPFGDK